MSTQIIDFDTYYNCAIVVAIKSKLADGSYKFLGYLCCDCLNKNAGIEIFDMQSAQILFALAQQYATFLETLAVNWESRVEEINDISQEFLQMIYSKLVKIIRIGMANCKWIITIEMMRQ